MKHLSTVLSCDVDFLNAAIDAIDADFADEPCQDNFRFADASVPEQVAEYVTAQSAGCCGSVDEELGPAPSGRTYLYGFNYGH